jgi:thiamine biosynthesis lipoprotein
MAVDDALALTGERGWVSAGGDVATTRPLEVGLPGDGSVRLERGALATSSSAVRRWLRGGTAQHHLIDPRTGRPAHTLWTHVTVCGATCVMADVAAKAAFLLGEDGPDWLDERGLPGRFLCDDGTAHQNAAWHAAAGAETVCI